MEGNIPFGVKIEEEALQKLNVEAVGVDPFLALLEEVEVSFEIFLHDGFNLAYLRKKKCYFQAIRIIHYFSWNFVF